MDRKILIVVSNCQYSIPNFSSLDKTHKNPGSMPPFTYSQMGRSITTIVQGSLQVFFFNINTYPQDSIQLAFEALCDQKQLFYYNTVLYKVLLKILYPQYS